MIPFPFKPLQAGHTIAFNDGMLSVALDGGPPRQRLDTVGAPDQVSASWVLKGDEYTLFMGAVRNWRRAGGEPLLMQLVHDSAEPDTYQVTFVPNTVRMISKNGEVFTVAANLLVLPLDKYLHPDLDIDALRAYLVSFYGSPKLASLALDLLREMMVEAWPHE